MTAKWTKRQQAAHRRKWVKALRSGKYQQAEGKLMADDLGNQSGGFCCLGVACDISGLGEWRGDRYCVGDKSSSLRLPEPVRDWLGLTTTSGDYALKSGATRALTEDNDGLNLRRSRTFKEIANIIEREPEGLIWS